MPNITDWNTDWNEAVKEPIAMLESLAKEARQLAVDTMNGLAGGNIMPSATLSAIRVVTAAEEAKKRLHEASTSLAMLATAHAEFYGPPLEPES